jgi:proline dehydrogenase
MAYYWRRAMIALAGSHRARGWALGFGPSSRLARRYVAGPDAAAAGARTETLLKDDGIRASLCFLGAVGAVADRPRANVEAAIAMTRELARRGLDIHISMDPSWAGHDVDRAAGLEHLRHVAQAIATLGAGRPGTHLLMLGMEEADRTDAILDLHRVLAAEGLPVGVTLQAYRRRSEADLGPLIEAGAKVRLVRGAYPAGGDIAFTTQVEIQANWRRLIDQMFSSTARGSGFRPIIATHDQAIQDHAHARALANGWDPREYEIEMLLGIRDGLARARARVGACMRLYVPFGEDWWSYTWRRIGDNPRNAWILLRSLVMGEG